MGEEKLDAWRENGTIPVFHYGEGKELPLAYDLMEDAAQFEPFPDVKQPCLIFHGTNDAVVPVMLSAEFAIGRPNVTLVRVNSGHELTDVLEEIWKASKDFVEADLE